MTFDLDRIALRVANEDLTRIYNEANGIAGGKNPPITTERIFNAMRACLAQSAKVPKAVRKWSNTGHGHVWERPDGVKARCGGPGICTECSRDAAVLAAIERGKEEEK